MVDIDTDLFHRRLSRLHTDWQVSLAIARKIYTHQTLELLHRRTRIDIVMQLLCASLMASVSLT